jgi:heme/copper-type cytochrome/quinol oxidase subunit 3
MSDDVTQDEVVAPEGPAIRFPLAWLEAGLGFFFLVLAGLYMAEAAKLPKPFSEGDVGAGRFPMIIGVLTLIATALVIRAAVASIMRGDGDKVAIHRPLMVVFGMATLVLQAFLFETVGAVVTIAMATLLFMLIGGERRPLHLIAVPALVTLGIYATFTLALGVRLT